MQKAKKRRRTWTGGKEVTRLKRVEVLKKCIREIKDTPCADCGGRFPPICMDFDHREPALKYDNVASMVSKGYALEAVLEEVAKCDIVCANCHRIRTFAES